MKNPFFLFLVGLRYIFPPIIAFLAVWLLPLENEWPFFRAIVFLSIYNLLVFGTHAMVFMPRAKPPMPWYILAAFSVVTVAAAYYLGLFGEIVAIALLGWQTPKLHTASMIHYGATSITMFQDAIIFATSILIAACVYFDFMSLFLAGWIGYAYYLFRAASDRFGKLPISRRFS